jgi:hypothetical protein
MNIQLGFSIPAYVPFSPQAANFVETIGSSVYEFSNLTGQQVLSIFNDPSTALDRKIAAYMVIASYESKDFVCDLKKEMNLLGIQDAVSAGAKIKDDYRGFPGLYETAGESVARAKAKLAAGQGAGVSLFILRIISMMDSGSAPDVTIIKSDKVNDPCKKEEADWVKYLKYGTIGVSAAIVGYLVYKAFKGGSDAGSSAVSRREASE